MRLLLACALLFAPEPQGPTLVQDVVIEAPEGAPSELARYLTVRPGEPLAPDTVSESVALLFATGAFADVIVETRPATDGVQLVFRPVLSPRLRRIRVRGDELLSSGKVAEIAGLGWREPLWSSRLERAAQDVGVSLADRGYLEARVEARAVAAPGGADAVFEIDAGQRAEVWQLHLQGLAGSERRGLVEQMRPRPGEPFDQERAEEARESIRRELVARGRWKARVVLRPVYDPRFTRVRLNFVVDPGLPVRLEIKGAEVPRVLEGELTALLWEGGAATDALEAVMDRLDAHFRRRGHRDVVVSYREESRGNHQAIVYQVDPGPKTETASVRLLGHQLDDVVLQTRPGSPVEDRLLEADVAAISAALERLGHAAPRVEAQVPEGGGRVGVSFRVSAGPQTSVRSYEVEASVELPGPAPRRRLRVGRPYRIRELARDRNDLLAAYRNAGYLDAEVEPQVSFAENRAEAEVRLRVLAGARTHVGRIVVARLEQTREVVVRRELTIGEGDPLSLQKVLDSQRRLGSLGIFSRVEIRELDPEGDRVRDLVILAEEAPQTTVAYGIGYGERELLRGSAEVTRRNLGGRDQSVTVFARASFRGSRFLTTYRVPYLFGRRRELFVSGFREEDDRESFDFVRYGSLAQTAFSLSPRLSLFARYSYQVTNTFNEAVPCEDVDRQFCDSTVSGPSASLVWDTRPDPLDPRRGLFLGTDIQLSHDLLGGDSFVKGFLQGQVYAPAGERVLLALSGRMGLARTLGLGEPLLLPLPERFFAGGDYSLRGFEVDSVNPEGGNALLLASAELRVNATRSLSVAGFAELGNVYPLITDMMLGDLRYTAGIGLRYKTALGPLRVDWGHKLNRLPGESASRWHFTIGHAF